MQTIYMAIVDMIAVFDKIGEDPKQAIAAIGKGVTRFVLKLHTTAVGIYFYDHYWYLGQ